MSRCYELTIVVDKYDDTKYKEIVDAVKDLGYDADADFMDNRILFNSETININAGRTEDEISSESLSGCVES